MAQQPSMLRALVTSRHWQVFETFRLQFERTANALAEHEADPALEGLTVSKRQFERWYGGEIKTRPYPAPCRVLEAMTAYEHASPDEWAFGDQAGSHTDLALARVRAGTLDGVEDALRPVLDLPAEQRIHGVVASVRQIHHALRDPRWLGAAEARALRGEIEAFSATPAAALPR